MRRVGPLAAGLAAAVVLPAAAAAQEAQRVPAAGGAGLAVEASAAGGVASIAVTAPAQLKGLRQPRPDELVLTFAGPIDGKPAASLPRQLSGWVRDVRYGYDSLLLIFTGPMRVDFDSLADGVAITLRRRAARQSGQGGEGGGQAERPGRSAELGLLRVQYLRQAGRRGDALAKARSVAQAHPDNPDAWQRVAELAEATGRWRSALAAFRRASKLAPQRSYPAESARRLARRHRPRLRSGSELRLGSTSTVQESVTAWRDYAAPRWEVGARTETVSLTLASYRRSDGAVLGPTTGVRGQASLYGRYHLPIGINATGRVYASSAGLGAGAALADPWAQGETRLALRANAPAQQPLGLRLQGGAVDRLRLKRQQSFAQWPVFASASLGWARYRLDGVAATQAELSAGAFWTLVAERPSWSLGYTLDGSYPRRVPTRTAADGTAYAPVDLGRTESHSVQVETGRRLGPKLTGSAALGASLERFSGGWGPFASGELAWRFQPPWTLRSTASTGLRWQDGRATTLSVGAELVWHYADGPGGGLRRWLHSE